MNKSEKCIACLLPIGECRSLRESIFTRGLLDLYESSYQKIINSTHQKIEQLFVHKHREAIEQITKFTDDSIVALRQKMKDQIQQNIKHQNIRAAWKNFQQAIRAAEARTKQQLN